ncbi:hypothetical protein BK412_21815 [Vibrio campbellii]|uniref:hypothetical protein n=1 Tax=Vibrio campbellii TaxID=680 RepID=UPI0009C0A407|nr:hypothetical protein [Vibrio campbellii]OQQ00552.1 hypothetical protein BK412_21815 [Vibrio campbellii]
MRFIAPFLLLLSPLAFADDCPDGEQMYQGQCRTTCEILALDSSPRAMRWDATVWGDAPTGYCRGSGSSGCELRRTAVTIQVNGSVFWQGDFKYTGASCSNVGEYTGDSPWTEPDDGNSDGGSGNDSGGDTGTDTGDGSDGTTDNGDDLDHGGGGNGGNSGSAYPDSNHPINHLRSIQEKQVISNNLLDRNTNEIIQLNASITDRLTDISSHLNTEQVNTNNYRNELKTSVRGITFAFQDANSTLKDLLQTMNSIDRKTTGGTGSNVDLSPLIASAAEIEKHTSGTYWFLDAMRKQVDSVADNTGAIKYQVTPILENIEQRMASGSQNTRIFRDGIRSDTRSIKANTNNIKREVINTKKAVQANKESVDAVKTAVEDQTASLEGALNQIVEAIGSGDDSDGGSQSGDNSDVVNKLGELGQQLGTSLDGIQEAIDGLDNGGVFDVPPTGSGWANGTEIGEAVDGLIDDIDKLKSNLKDMQSKSPISLGKMNFNDGNYSGETFRLSRDSWNVDVQFNLFNTLGTNTGSIRNVIIFAAMLMAAFIILSSGRKGS